MRCLDARMGREGSSRCFIVSLSTASYSAAIGQLYTLMSAYYAGPVVYELLRITLPRTPLNKGIKKGRNS